MSLISVIVPVYKVEPYLRRCVDSILAQTFVDFELILVDDGSPDQCPTICDEYAAKDSRVKVIHQPNGGLSAARNTGLDWIFTHSDSQWVFFLDSDDWIHPVTLECLLDANQKFNTNVSICGYEETSGANPEVNITDLSPSLRETEQFFVEHNINAVVAWGKLYRKACFQTIRYPVGKIHEDEYTTYKILFQAPSVAFVAAPLYAYFANPRGITKVQWSPQRLDAIDAFEQQCAYFEANGFKKAFHRSCIMYIAYLACQTKMLTQEYADMKSEFLKKILHALKKYHQTADISIEKDAWIYWEVFPFFMPMRLICSNVKKFGFLATLAIIFRKLLYGKSK